ncbi:methyl-accepting chemotaxis protein, partial [Endobacterium cereale]|nr:methyl-accepting chemotaxis protein [Endobacterium cereale]
ANEAGRLRELISQFQLGQGQGMANPRSALRQTAAIMAASSRSAPAASPARGMVGKIARAFTGRGGPATAAATDNWEEF